MRALPSLLHVLVTFAALTSTCGAGAEEDTNSVGTVNKVENEAQVISPRAPSPPRLARRCM